MARIIDDGWDEPTPQVSAPVAAQPVKTAQANPGMGFYDFSAKDNANLVDVPGVGNVLMFFDEPNGRVVVSDEGYWNPNSPTGDKLQKAIDWAHDRGYKAGVTVSPYAYEGMGDSSVGGIGRPMSAASMDQLKAYATQGDFAVVDPYLMNAATATPEMQDKFKAFTNEIGSYAKDNGKDSWLYLQGFSGSDVNPNVVSKYNQDLIDQSKGTFGSMSFFNKADMGEDTTGITQLDTSAHAASVPSYTPQPQPARTAAQQAQPTMKADLRLINGTPQSKADYYNNLIGQGYTDADIRAAFGGIPEDNPDWKYLRELAASSSTLAPVAESPPVVSEVPAAIAPPVAAPQGALSQAAQPQPGGYYTQEAVSTGYGGEGGFDYQNVWHAGDNPATSAKVEGFDPSGLDKQYSVGPIQASEQNDGSPGIQSGWSKSLGGGKTQQYGMYGQDLGVSQDKDQMDYVKQLAAMAASAYLPGVFNSALGAGGMLGTNLSGMGLSAATGALTGATTAGITGGNILQGALMGGAGGALTNYLAPANLDPMQNMANANFDIAEMGDLASPGLTGDPYNYLPAPGDAVARPFDQYFETPVTTAALPDEWSGLGTTTTDGGKAASWASSMADSATAAGSTPAQAGAAAQAAADVSIAGGTWDEAAAAANKAMAAVVPAPVVDVPAQVGMEGALTQAYSTPGSVSTTTPTTDTTGALSQASNTLNDVVVTSSGALPAAAPPTVVIPPIMGGLTSASTALPKVEVAAPKEIVKAEDVPAPVVIPSITGPLTTTATELPKVEVKPTETVKTEEVAPPVVIPDVVGPLTTTTQEATLPKVEVTGKNEVVQAEEAPAPVIIPNAVGPLTTTTTLPKVEVAAPKDVIKTEDTPATVVVPNVPTGALSQVNVVGSKEVPAEVKSDETVAPIVTLPPVSTELPKVDVTAKNKVINTEDTLPAIIPDVVGPLTTTAELPKVDVTAAKEVAKVEDTPAVFIPPNLNTDLGYNSAVIKADTPTLDTVEVKAKADDKNVDGTPIGGVGVNTSAVSTGTPSVDTTKSTLDKIEDKFKDKDGNIDWIKVLGAAGVILPAVGKVATAITGATGGGPTGTPKTIDQLKAELGLTTGTPGGVNTGGPSAYTPSTWAPFKAGNQLGRIYSADMFSPVVAGKRYAEGGEVQGALTTAAPFVGFVQGPGGGQDDAIDAKLSAGEYVFDAESVSNLGDGNNEEGARKLDELRQALRAHKRSAPNDSIPPQARGALSYMNGGLNG